MIGLNEKKICVNISRVRRLDRLNSRASMESVAILNLDVLNLIKLKNLRPYHSL